MHDGKYRRRRRADSDSGIHSLGSGSSARSRLSRSPWNNQDKLIHKETGLHHDYSWRQNISMDTREGHKRGRRSGSHEYGRNESHEYRRSGSYDYERSGNTSYALKYLY